MQKLKAEPLTHTEAMSENEVVYPKLTMYAICTIYCLSYQIFFAIALVKLSVFLYGQYQISFILIYEFMMLAFYTTDSFGIFIN